MVQGSSGRQVAQRQKPSKHVGWLPKDQPDVARGKMSRKNPPRNGTGQQCEAGVPELPTQVRHLCGATSLVPAQVPGKHLKLVARSCSQSGVRPQFAFKYFGPAVMVFAWFGWQRGMEDRSVVGPKRRRAAALQDASRNSGGRRIARWITGNEH